MSEKSLTQRSARGGVNALGGQAAKIVLGLASLSILARMLSPEDYGLMAMVLTIVSIAEVFKDFGLSTAAVQAKTLSAQEKTNLWWLNTGIGALLCLVVAALSPLVAWFYQDERLLPITVLMSLNFLISGMTVQYFAQMQREIEFGKIALNNILSNLIGLGIAFIFAAQGYGVWALVAQGITISLASLLLCLVQTGWLPGIYRSSTSVKKFLNFGLPLMFSNLLTHFSAALDSLLIGRLAQAEVLGYYNRAYQAVRTPLNSLRSPLNNVGFSALSKKKASKEELLELAGKGQILLGYPLALLGGGFAAASTPLVLLFLGPQWSDSVPFFAWLAIAEGLHCLALTAGWIFLTTGQSKYVFKLTLANTVIRIIFVVVGGLIAGPLGVVVGNAVSVFIQWPLAIILAGRSLRLSTRSMLLSSYRMFGVVLLSSLVTYGVSQLLSINLLLDLLLLALVHILSAGACALLPAVRLDYQLIFSLVRSMRK